MNGLAEPRAVERRRSIPAAKATRSRYHWTPEIDEMIRQAHNGADYKSTGAVRRLAARLGFPLRVVSRRAERLGVSRIVVERWSDEETAVVRRNAHLSPIVIVRKLRKAGYRRTLCAVVNKIQAGRIRREGYSAEELAELMHVNARTISRWIESGKLKAQRVEKSNAAEGFYWFIRPRVLRRFLIEHLGEVEIRRCDKYWLVDLLTNKIAD